MTMPFAVEVAISHFRTKTLFYRWPYLYD